MDQAVWGDKLHGCRCWDCSQRKELLLWRRGNERFPLAKQKTMLAKSKIPHLPRAASVDADSPYLKPPTLSDRNSSGVCHQVVQSCQTQFHTLSPSELTKTHLLSPCQGCSHLWQRPSPASLSSQRRPFCLHYSHLRAQLETPTLPINSSEELSFLSAAV